MAPVAKILASNFDRIRLKTFFLPRSRSSPSSPTSRANKECSRQRSTISGNRSPPCAPPEYQPALPFPRCLDHHRISRCKGSRCEASSVSRAINSARSAWFLIAESSLVASSTANASGDILEETEMALSTRLPQKCEKSFFTGCPVSWFPPRGFVRVCAFLARNLPLCAH
jgi:hypothetical protein